MVEMEMVVMVAMVVIRVKIAFLVFMCAPLV
jgi:hypothetical protein